MNLDPFQEYMRDSEPGKREKGYAWRTGIGLQAVDGLKISDYLLHTAARNIEGEISFQEAKALLQSYYEEHPSRNFEDRTEEADKVSVRIAELNTANGKDNVTLVKSGIPLWKRSSKRKKNTNGKRKMSRMIALAQEKPTNTSAYMKSPRKRKCDWIAVTKS